MNLSDILKKRVGDPEKEKAKDYREELLKRRRPSARAKVQPDSRVPKRSGDDVLDARERVLQTLKSSGIPMHLLKVIYVKAFDDLVEAELNYVSPQEDY